MEGSEELPQYKLAGGFPDSSRPSESQSPSLSTIQQKQKKAGRVGEVIGGGRVLGRADRTQLAGDSFGPLDLVLLCNLS